jgi:hypothetical protein
VDLVAGLPDQTAGAAGAAWEPADLAVSMVAASVDSTAAVVDASVRENSDKRRMRHARFGGMDMSHLLGISKLQAFRAGLSLILFATIISLASCRKPENVAARNEGQKTFASPQAAGIALLEAAKSGNQASLLEIFGPDWKEVLFTGDSVKDANALKNFAVAYERMNRWRKINAGGEMLYIGTESFPFPIPLQQTSSGQWFFNTAAGQDEMLARRVGKDELIAIAALGAIANAQEQYFNQPHPGDNVKQYAQKFVSDEGKHNGLYWPASKGEQQSPLGQLGDFAKGAGFSNSGKNPQPFNGYYFRILTKAGVKDYVVNGKMTDGFAILAYPAEYQNSGIMAFLVGKDGIVFEKDLGEGTANTALAITEYNPADGWKPVHDDNTRASR